MKKKNKTPRFLICENPMTAAEDGRLFILHFRMPILIAEVHHYDDISDDERMDIERKLANPGGLAWKAYIRLDFPPETIFFRLIHVEQHSEFTMLSQQSQDDELASIMGRMADWYESYLIWEDKNL